MFRAAPGKATGNPLGIIAGISIPLAALTQVGTAYQVPLSAYLPEQGQNSAMAEYPTHTELDAKLGKMSAETDTKITRMEGKLDTLLQKLDYALKDNSETRTTIREEARSTRELSWVIALGFLAIIIAGAALYPVVFDMGGKNQDSIDRSVKSYLDHARQIATP